MAGKGQIRQKQQMSTILLKWQTFEYLKISPDTDIGVTYERRAQKMQNVWGVTLSKNNNNEIFWCIAFFPATKEAGSGQHRTERGL